jgi:hypothetical protein
MPRSQHVALVALVVCLTALAPLTATAGANRGNFTPPHHRVWHGVSDTGRTVDFRSFARQVKAHPAIDEVFYHWDVSLTASGALHRWHKTHTRGVVSLSNALPAHGGNQITPHDIARGRGDHYILRLNESIAHSGQTVYMRPFAEMNGHWNPYCAFNANGTRRHEHSTKNFRRAWRRLVIIVRGGPRQKVNHRLRHRGMPRIYRARSNHDRIYHRRDVPSHLPHPRVAFMWNPQTTGSPDVPGNEPRAYWPGRQFVDWVGVDIYSKFRSAAFPKMRTFYHRWNNWPFVIGEYGPWDDDYNGSFTRHLLQWEGKNHRVRMLIYYRSVSTHNAYAINNYKGAKRALRHGLNRRRFQPYAPGTR